MSILKKPKSPGPGYTKEEIALALAPYMDDLAIRMCASESNDKIERIDVYYTQSILSRDTHYILFEIMKDHKFRTDGFSKHIGNNAGFSSTDQDEILLRVTYLTDENL